MMLKQSQAFMVFRSSIDAERYSYAESEADRQAVRALFDAGKAAYLSATCPFTIVEESPDEPCVQIESENLYGRFFMHARIARLLRWRLVSEDEYAAVDWINRAFSAWRENELPEAERAFAQAYASNDATIEQRAQALLLRGEILAGQDRPEEALLLFSELDWRFAAEACPTWS